MKKYAFIGLLLAAIAHAGTNNLPTETGPVIQLSHVNKFKTALSGDIVPRDASGTVADIASSVGQSSNRWLHVYTKQLDLLYGASSNAISFLAPNGVSAPYSLTFPAALPGSTLPFQVTSGGTITYAQIPTGGIADGAVTQAKRAALGQQISSSTGAGQVEITYNGGTWQDVTNLSVTITTTGRPVIIGLMPDLVNGVGRIVSKTTALLLLQILRDSTQVYYSGMGDSANLVTYPASVVYCLDTPAAGTYTYKLQGKGSQDFAGGYIYYLKLFAFEL